LNAIHLGTYVRISWTLDDGTLFATAMIGPGFPVYRLIAEQLPNQDTWDWTVWWPGGIHSIVSHGAASSVIAAMTDAQAAARRLEGLAFGVTACRQL
jgi:hypothetical protein